MNKQNENNFFNIMGLVTDPLFKRIEELHKGLTVFRGSPTKRPNEPNDLKP